MPDHYTITATLREDATVALYQGVDYRSDLYSLDIIFYQMLIGQLPFQATDPLERAHCHIAGYQFHRTRFGKQLIPKPLATIVMKLLAKQPEARYQSILGLIQDLKYIQAHYHVERL